MKKIFPVSIAAFMINARVDFNLKNLLLRSPSAKAVKALVHESTVDSMFIARKEMLKEEAKVYLSCDKGHSGYGHFVKKILWYSKTEARVKKLP